MNRYQGIVRVVVEAVSLGERDCEDFAGELTTDIWPDPAGQVLEDGGVVTIEYRLERFRARQRLPDCLAVGGSDFHTSDPGRK